MKDFTLERYTTYLKAIQSTCPNVLLFRELFEGNTTDSFCIIRHDVDRKPGHALRMAQLEHRLGIKATYYFRIKNHTFKPDIIQQIHQMGHEVGYHYECLSDAQGDIKKATELFEANLIRLRNIVPATTIAMHGRPFSPHDNRDMWRDSKDRALLKSHYKILAEVYLDIDYRNIFYINDTGRNWLSQRSNIRDHVNSELECDFHSSDELLKFLQAAKTKKIIFQIHPERWSCNRGEWYQQLLRDKLTNFAKSVIKH